MNDFRNSKRYINNAAFNNSGEPVTEQTAPGDPAVPWLQDPDVTLYHGDCLDVLRQLPSSSVHMCATSPPFYGLRDYGTGEWEGGQPDCDHVAPPIGGAQAGSPHSTLGPERDGLSPDNAAFAASKGAKYRNECGRCGARRVDKQIGLEETPDQWVTSLVTVFREVRRVLRDDGTLWVEIGDSYNGSGGYAGPDAPINKRRAEGDGWGKMNPASSSALEAKRGVNTPTCKAKDLLGQPWLLAFALRQDGWWLRSEIIWARPNPMPESVTDRPTKSHSTVFLLSKQPRYFYDADAIREPFAESTVRIHSSPGVQKQASEWKVQRNPDRNEQDGLAFGGNGASRFKYGGANARSVWTIPTQPTPYAHFATWPEALVRRMILAGSPEGGIVLDPFAGSATTNLVARNTGRHSIGIELNADYLQIAATRLQQLSLLT